MKKRILVVDDEPDIAESLKTLLEKEGHEVIIAGDGIQCLDMLNDGLDPELIIMDFFMPEMSGRTTIEKIRLAHPEKDFKIIFLTVAEFHEKGIDDIKILGVLDYIQKPIDIENFMKRIKKVLK